MKKYAGLLLIFLIVSACSGLNRLSLYNLSNQYDDSKFTSLEATAYNTGSGEYLVYVTVFMQDMVIVNDEETGSSHRDASIAYHLFDNYDSKQILDSSTLVISDTRLEIFDTLITLPIKYNADGKYILKIELTDLNRVDAVDHYITIDNTNKQSVNNFLLKDASGELLYNNVITEDENFLLEYMDRGTKQLFVRYYDREFPLALPPFLEDTETNFDYGADSVFTVDLADGRTGLLQFHDEGFYHFQVDSNLRGGFTIFRFKKGFPAVITPEQMLEPLRYITTLAEYEQIENAVDLKLSVDNFWLENSGNPTRARAMIQKFYGRVEEANRYFTSYHEGWKTDRGLIYIVYGPPRIVYRGENTEEWLYGEQGNKSSIRLQFIKVVNPFSENDYSLLKSPSYKEKWYNIVSTWRR